MCKYLIVPALVAGFNPAVLAQPSDAYTWNYLISFTGSGTLPVSATSYAVAGVSDPTITTAFTGTGTDVLTETSPGVYADTSSVTGSGYASISTSKTSGYFSVSQPFFQGHPVGIDPGISMIGYGPNFPYPSPYPVNGSPSPAPFYGLFPPPSGVDYDGTIAPTGVQDFFNYDSSVLNVGFGSSVADGNSGEVDLVLGDNPVLASIVPDPSMPGEAYYTFTYADSQFDLSADIGEADPFTTTTGTATISILAAAPDSGAGIVGGLTLLGVCGFAAWQKKARLA